MGSVILLSIRGRRYIFFDAFKKAGGAGEKIEYPGLGHFVTTNMMDDAVAWMETVN